MDKNKQQIDKQEIRSQRESTRNIDIKAHKFAHIKIPYKHQIENQNG